MSLRDDDCIFCEIVSGKRQARIVARNDVAIAFLDAFPLTEGHVLVIPRFHIAKLQDVPQNITRGIFDLVWKLSGAVEKATGAQASTVALHNGRAAGQEIPHVHFHVIPRFADDGAGPVHTMFKKRPHLSSQQFDSLSHRISASVGDRPDH